MVGKRPPARPGSAVAWFPAKRHQNTSGKISGPLRCSTAVKIQVFHREYPEIGAFSRIRGEWSSNGDEPQPSGFLGKSGPNVRGL